MKDDPAWVVKDILTEGRRERGEENGEKWCAMYYYSGDFLFFLRAYNRKPELKRKEAEPKKK